MPDLHFRLATDADLPDIRDILNQAIRQGGANAFLREVDLEDRRRWFAQHSPDRFPVYVAEIAGQVVGWFSFSGYRAARKALAGVAEIAYYLDERWRGQGYGTQLLRGLVRVGEQLNFEHLLAILLDSNTASVRLLESAGFQQWGHLPDIAKVRDGRAGQYYYGRDIRP